MHKRRVFSAEFKQETASLVLDEHYTIKNTCELMNVGDSTLKKWVANLRLERQGITPIQGPAITAEHKEIQRLKEKERTERPICQKLIELHQQSPGSSGCRTLSAALKIAGFTIG